MIDCIVAFEVLWNLQRECSQHTRNFLVTGTTAIERGHLWQSRDMLQNAMVEGHSANYLISVARYIEDTAFVKSILPLISKDMPLLMSYR